MFVFPTCSALLLLYIDGELWIECFKCCVHRLLQGISRKASLPPPPHSNSRFAGTSKDMPSKALWCRYRADIGYPVKIKSDQTRWKFKGKGVVKNKNNRFNEGKKTIVWLFQCCTLSLICCYSFKHVLSWHTGCPKTCLITMLLW